MWKLNRMYIMHLRLLYGKTASSSKEMLLIFLRFSRKRKETPQMIDNQTLFHHGSILIFGNIIIGNLLRIWHSKLSSTSKFSKSRSSNDYSVCCVVNFQTMTCTRYIFCRFQLTVCCCFPGINEDCLPWRDIVWEVLGFNSEHKPMINCKLSYIYQHVL